MVGGGVVVGSVDVLPLVVSVVGSVTVVDAPVGSLLEGVDADGVELAPPGSAPPCAPAPRVAKSSNPSSSRMRNKTVIGIHLLVLYIVLIPQFFSRWDNHCYNVCGQAVG